MFPDEGPSKLRSRVRAFNRKQPPECTVVGVTADEKGRSDDEVVKEACERWEREKRLEERRQQQRIVFSHGPAGLVFLGDLHFGGYGVDYPRAFAEAKVIRETPGLYACFVGDSVNNFIIGKLARQALTGELAIDDQWKIFRKWLTIIGPKLRLVVSGNHESWTRKLAGIDYMRECTAAICPGVLYDRDDCRVTLQVGEREWKGRIRHKWKGFSQFNKYHGIKKAALWDQDFTWGVGAHTHSSGGVAGFNAGGISGMAVMCGTYKRIDNFARSSGFPKPNDCIAVTLVFDEDTNSITGFESLPMVAAFMREMYGSTS